MRRANTAKDKPETTMTRFFIAGIATLFLATGSAQAGYNNWKCGDNVTLQTAVEKINPPNALPVTYGFYIEGLRVPKVRVTIDRDGQPHLNGKRCIWKEAERLNEEEGKNP